MVRQRLLDLPQLTTMSCRELIVQKYLRSGNTLDKLKDEFAVDGTRHPRYNNLIHLKYDQIGADWSNELTKECRGLILDENNDYAVVARPFDKFFNYGESHAADIDWASSTVDEKLDGSLCILYWYDGMWHVATTGTPDGGGEVSGYSFTFNDLFFRTLGNSRPDEYHSNCTFMLELMSPYNRIVVSHPKPIVKLIAVRENNTGNYLPMDNLLWRGGVPKRVRSFKLSSIDKIIDTFDTMSPLEQEGYVVHDRHGNRIKVKHPGYVAIHHVVFGLSERRMVDIVLANEVPEVLVSFPELSDHIDKIKSKIDAYCDGAIAKFAEIKDIEDQKTFALTAKDSPYSTLLFMLRQQPKEEPYALLRKMITKRVMHLCGIREIAKETVRES